VSSSSLEARDGRQSRTARSRLAICEACLDLVREGVLQPSAEQIADRAGVSRRSVFNHFADLAELYDAVVEVGMERAAPLLEEISVDQPVARRVEEFVRIRSTFLEAAAPFTRALTAQALVGPAADQAARVARNALRRQHQEIERLFARELASLAAADRSEILEALSTASSPLQWEVLRRSRGNSIARARAVLRRTLSALLHDPGVA